MGGRNSRRVKERITDGESERSFEQTLFVYPKLAGARNSLRDFAKTYGNRLLTVVFTIRSGKVRVISARPISRTRERCMKEINAPRSSGSAERARVLEYACYDGLLRFAQGQPPRVEFDPSVKAPVKFISLRLARDAKPTQGFV
jgi:hypothetical protein